jgi:methionyl-tRNA synthetase
MEKKPFYITTTIPYVNADPHIGFALELVQSDILARAAELQGREVFFTTGTDEHGQKVAEAAKKEGRETQAYVDEYAERFRLLKEKLNLHPHLHFVRTTDPHHVSAAQHMWQTCLAQGDIYKKKYKGLYCVGDEAFIKETDLVDGRCPNHPNLEIQEVEEENYFFNLSKYKAQVREYLLKPMSVVPEWRRNEALKALEGMEDISISREAKRFSWGVPVPGDETQVMYVWFDALTNYISTLGWPEDAEGKFKKFWQEGETVQTAGKDQVKFQSILWQAMLFSVGIKNTDTVVYHGFINSGGQKMSKSLGNVIHPDTLIAEYGVDALRYCLARHVSTFDDSDVTPESFKEIYNGNLANGIGNLASRIMTLAQAHLDAPAVIPEREDMSAYVALLNAFEINKAINFVWEKIADLDREIQEKKPWETKDKEAIASLVVKLYSIARMLNPFMPETSAKIKALVKENRKPEAPLFARKD